MHDYATYCVMFVLCDGLMSPIASGVTTDDVLSQNRRATAYKTERYDTGNSRDCRFKCPCPCVIPLFNDMCFHSQPNSCFKMYSTEYYMEVTQHKFIGLIELHLSPALLVAAIDWITMLLSRTMSAEKRKKGRAHVLLEFCLHSHVSRYTISRPYTAHGRCFLSVSGTLNQKRVFVPLVMTLQRLPRLAARHFPFNARFFSAKIWSPLHQC